MTTLPMLTFFIMPVGGLIIGLVGLYLTRHTRRHPHPGRVAHMTTLHMLSFFIMPVGALVVAGLGFLWVRTWDMHDQNRASSAALSLPVPGGGQPHSSGDPGESDFSILAK